jgi:hypothetical protein
LGETYFYTLKGAALQNMNII